MIRSIGPEAGRMRGSLVRSRVVGRWLAVLVLVLLGASEAQAQSDIRVAKAANGQDVTITITGTNPYAVYRSSLPIFSGLVEQLASGLTAPSLFDQGALVASEPVYYYDVAGVGESSPATASGGPPQPSVKITLLTANAGMSGDSVVIDGTGFAQFYSENLVTFNGRPATITTGTTTSVTVQVPSGATSGPVQVRVGRLVSNTLPFTVAPATGFTNLSGIAVNPTNDHLFVTDTGQPFGTALVEVDPFTSWTKTPRAGIANIRGIPLSADGRLYYSNASRSTFNGGTIEYWTLSSGTEATFPTSGGVASSDPVACVGMGASPANTSFVFYADYRNQQVRRIGSGGGRTTYSSGFGFPTSDYNPANVAGIAGLAFDSNGTSGTTNFGDLYVADGTTITRVTQNNPLGAPDNTSKATVLSGLGGPAGIFFDETRTLHITDKIDGAIRLFHPDGTASSVRLSGLSSPRGAILAETNDVPAETRLYIAEPTRIVAADDLRVELSPHENIRALISNCPLPNQTPGCVGFPYPTSYQTQAREVLVTAQVHPPRAGVAIYFDTEDPAATTPYAPYFPGDNVDGPGSLSDPGPVLTDVNGRATTVLTITATSSGENYRVVAQLASSGPVVAKTGIITAWKRWYVEQDKTFRAPGQYLTQAVAAGQNELNVATTARFDVGDLVLVFDTVNDIPEFATVQAKTITTLTLLNNLSTSYSDLNKAYVGRLADGFYESDLSTAYVGYDQAFIELVYSPIGSNLLPYATPLELNTTQLRRDFSALWFKNGKNQIDGTNYAHLLAVASEDPGVTGITEAVSNYSYSYIQEILNLCTSCTPEEIANYIRHNAIHEMGHQSGILNPNGSPPSWCNPGVCTGDITTMSLSTERKDDIDEFSITELIGPAPSLRHSPDPI